MQINRKGLEGIDWIHLALDRDKWQADVKQ